MSDLVVIVPSRGRPSAADQLIGQFAETCTADTRLVFAVDEDDPSIEQYVRIVTDAAQPWAQMGLVEDPSTMVHALNRAAVMLASTLNPPPFALGFLGDDHRPRTKGWDQAYLDALKGLGTGIVYGDDLFQRERLPTQCAMTADIVRALGYMAPPSLVHLAVDNWWLQLGRDAGCIQYLPDVVVEHMHPGAGKGEWDENYARVNAQEVYVRDLAEFERLCSDGLPQAVAVVRMLRGERA